MGLNTNKKAISRPGSIQVKTGKIYDILFTGYKLFRNSIFSLTAILVITASTK